MNSVDTNLEIIQSLDFDEANGCEIPKHSSNKELHEGKGEWYVSSDCPKCKQNSGDGVVLVCNKYKDFLVADEKTRICCRCFATTSFKECITVLGKVGNNE